MKLVDADALCAALAQKKNWANLLGYHETTKLIQDLPDASQPLRERVAKLEAFVAKMAKGEHSLVKYYDLSEEAEALLKESDHA